MSIIRFCTGGAHAIATRAVLLACVSVVALFAVGGGVSVATAGPPHYYLSITEGETTLPEYSVAHVSGGVNPNAEVVVSITRGGIVVARSAGEGAWLSQVPQTGDLVTLESAGRMIGSVVYDGLPSIDATVCAGSTNFSGQRSGAETVEGSFFSIYVIPYHHQVKETGFGQAQVTSLSGSSFAGNFLSPLAIGQTVTATESIDTALAGGGVFTYSSETDRPVGACPAPPPPPPPPPAPIVRALVGSIAKLVHTTIHALLGSGWHDVVTINQPGTVTQDLYRQGGALPAYASSSHRHPHRRPALLLAHGAVAVAAAGRATVVVRATPKGRRVLRSARSVKAVLITTLRSKSGAKLNLPRRTLTLHR